MSEQEIPDRVVRKYGFERLSAGDSFEVGTGVEAREVAKLFSKWCELNRTPMAARSERDKRRDAWRVLISG